MLTLFTSNPAKYAPFARRLERMRIGLESPKMPLAEIQTLSFAQTLAAKARLAAEGSGRPALVDDAGLVLDAYPSFPGPLTSVVVRHLGVDGLRRLLTGLGAGAKMECHIGGWFSGSLRSWSGVVKGRLDFTRKPTDAKMILTDIFVPEEPAAEGVLLHRARALDALSEDIFGVHLDAAGADAGTSCPEPTGVGCVFCDELEDEAESIFANVIQGRLASRIVYEDEDFVVMPPLGQFIEGGLLLLARQHIPSFACLPAALYARLERLVAAICDTLRESYGIAPVVFEHGPSSQWRKGGCCVDHAHFNIFPAKAPMHERLAERMNLRIDSLAALARLRRAEFGYLFVQENDGARRVYDGQDAPTQLVRRIITAAIGQPERWDWRDYPGLDELIATYKTLKGKIHR